MEPEEKPECEKYPQEVYLATQVSYVVVDYLRKAKSENQ
jgi:hypothetical protein